MSSMLEQAIIDAAALREAALKNAEQSLIEKYAPQIKEAVEAMLENDETNEGYRRGSKVKYEGKIAEVTTESDNGMIGVSVGGKTHLVNESELQNLTEDELLQEEEVGAAPVPAAGIEGPFSGNPNIEPDQTVDFSINVEEFDDVLSINLQDLEDEIAGMEMGSDAVSIADLADEEAGLEDLEATSDIGDETEPALDDDIQLQELLDLLEDYDSDMLEEKARADMGAEKQGWVTTDVPHQEYEQNMQMAADNLNEEEDEEDAEVIDEEEDKSSELYETINLLKSQNEKLEAIVYKLNDKLEETLLSNAKLLYQNRTLSDASLNERQKEKIVEAIAKAESPKEAKHLHETLRTTMGTSKKKAPKSLNESVNNRPNLSGMLNGRQNLKESKNSNNSFVKKMQKLAGIK
jgi:hypothetical protein